MVVCLGGAALQL